MIADWGVVGDSGDQGAVKLDDGQLEVRISSNSADILSIEGALRPAYQVSYIASDPPRGDGFHVADEWLGVEDSKTVESRMPSVLQSGDQVLHHRHFTKTGWAGLMYAPDFWNERMSEGDRWSVSFPEGYPNTRPNISQTTASFTVEQTRETNGECRAEVQVRHPYADASLTLSENRPVPVSYEAKTADLEFEMALETWEPGEGPNLPPLDRSADSTSNRIPLEPIENHFLADAEGVLATDWPTALEAIEDDEEAQAWLEEHPAAAVSEFDYV